MIKNKKDNDIEDEKLVRIPISAVLGVQRIRFKPTMKSQPTRYTTMRDR